MWIRLSLPICIIDRHIYTILCQCMAMKIYMNTAERKWCFINLEAGIFNRVDNK